MLELSEQKILHIHMILTLHQWIKNKRIKNQWLTTWSSRFSHKNQEKVSELGL